MFEDFDDKIKDNKPPTSPEIPRQPDSIPVANNQSAEKEPEDIFANVEKDQMSKPTQPPRPAQAPGQPKDIGPAKPLQAMPAADGASQTGHKRWLWAVIGLVVIVAIGIWWWSAYSTPDNYSDLVNNPLDNQMNNQMNNQINNAPTDLVNNQPVDIPTDNQLDNNSGEIINQPIDNVDQPSANPDINIDTDGDGLTDKQEATIGTDPSQADSDADGLFDKEEVVTYNTDPLNPDTDGDGYADGLEVQSGYNPAGEGKLLNIPTDQ
ncbi:MAG: hypothetical protein ACKKL5_01125 [Candidatus Komeilibacteria bacterium]